MRLLADTWYEVMQQWHENETHDYEIHNTAYTNNFIIKC